MPYKRPSTFGDTLARFLDKSDEDSLSIDLRPIHKYGRELVILWAEGTILPTREELVELADLLELSRAEYDQLEEAYNFSESMGIPTLEQSLANIAQKFQRVEARDRNISAFGITLAHLSGKSDEEIFQIDSRLARKYGEEEVLLWIINEELPARNELVELADLLELSPADYKQLEEAYNYSESIGIPTLGQKVAVFAQRVQNYKPSKKQETQPKETRDVASKDKIKGQVSASSGVAIGKNITQILSTVGKRDEQYQIVLNWDGKMRLRGFDLSNQDLSALRLSGADLRRANLASADLNETNLGQANLRKANLQNADLRGADLRGADLRETDLSGADLSGADLSEADLSEADLSGVEYNSQTKWPEEFILPEGIRKLDEK